MQDLSHSVEFLSGVQPLTLLDRGQLDWLAARIEAAYYPSHKVILESVGLSGLAIIRKGAVRLLDEDGKFLDKRSEGEIFGHEIYFHGEKKPYRAMAEEDSLVWHFSQEAFDRLCAENAGFAEYFSAQPQVRLSTAIAVPEQSRTLGELLRRPAILVDSDNAINDVARLMKSENISSVLVREQGKLTGIVTDKDFRSRVLAEDLPPTDPVGSVMTPSPRSLPVSATVDEALLLMMRHNCRHLPIMDGDRPMGVLTAGDLLRMHSEHPLRLVSDINKQTTIDGLLGLSRRLPLLFVRMVKLGRDAEQIGRLVTGITDAFTIRLIQIAEQQLGAPPIPYAWVVFGSQAREEQTARTDQDNGLILSARPDEEQARWFARMAEFVCDGLDHLGFVYCPGEVMALNVKWRLTLRQWKRQFAVWIEQPDKRSVMHCSIFFDIRHVSGDRSLVAELQHFAVQLANKDQFFLRFLAANALGHRPPLGFFRRFVQEHDGSHSEEGLNLKHRGIVPIIDLVRIRALEGAISESNTNERIRLAAAAGLLNESDAASLADALELIGQIRLEHQARQLAAGEKATNLVPPEALSPLMRRNLKAAFMLVQEAQNALALRYQVG